MRSPTRGPCLSLALAAFVACFAPSAATAQTPRAEVARAATPTIEMPGCAIQARLAQCLDRSGNARESSRCLEPALRAANEAHERVLDAARTRFEPTSPPATTLDAADRAWRAFARADCAAVSADWEGGAMQSSMRTDCLYRHTLERAQTLWSRHLAPDESAIPQSCKPQP